MSEERGAGKSAVSEALSLLSYTLFSPMCPNASEGTEKNVVYYESIKRELKTRPIYECRCDERLKTKAEESTRRTYTGLLGELEHPKIETKLGYVRGHGYQVIWVKLH